MKSDNFVVIQGWMVNELNLKGNDLLVFALIYGFTRDGKTKFASGRNYIAESFNISLPTVDKALQNLIALNYIIKIPCENQADTDKYYANISSKETLSPKNISSKETLHNKYIKDTNNQQSLFTDNNISNNKNKEVLEVRKRERGQWFVDTYNSICVSLPKCARLTAKRSKGISNILKKFTDEEILEVFRKLEASDFCTNRSNKGWKADIDFILREDKFVSVLEGKYDNKSTGRSAKSVETTSLKEGEVARVVSKEEREELRRMVERGELEEY